MMFALEPHGPDTYVGTGPRYSWGGLYGGQIVAQALRAASLTVEPEFVVHSIRAYFIRPGDHTEPIRFEVDRIRNGRSFVTRRVVARQAIGAILNAECSLQRVEESASVQAVSIPDVPGPDEIEPSSWNEAFDRRWVAHDVLAADERTGVGRTAAWFRVVSDLGDPADPEADLLHRCWLAYLSDDLPFDAVRQAHPEARDDDEHFGGASLDHTIWFHRPMRADRWHLHDLTCHGFVGNRGLAIGHVFTVEGEHVATVAQEVLFRDRRGKPG